MEQGQNESQVVSNEDNLQRETSRPVLPDIQQREQSNPASRPTTESPALAIAQRLTGKALDFLSNASQETLGACIVGLGASTYLVLGRLGLIIIGVVGGIVLHATWEGNRDDSGDDVQATQSKRRREAGIDVVSRVLQWRQAEASIAKSDTIDGITSVSTAPADQSTDFRSFPPATKAALMGLTDAVVRDYVKYSASILTMCSRSQ